MIDTEYSQRRVHNLANRAGTGGVIDDLSALLDEGPDVPLLARRWRHVRRPWPPYGSELRHLGDMHRELHSSNQRSAILWCREEIARDFRLGVGSRAPQTNLTPAGRL